MNSRILGTCVLVLLAVGCDGPGGGPIVDNHELEPGVEGLPGVPARGPLEVGTRLRTTSGLNLRGGPGTSFAIVLTMPSGATVSVLQSAPTNNFYNVQYEGVSGWASASYLVLADSSPPTPPPPSGETPPKISITGPAVLPHAQSFANYACAAVGCPYTVGTRVGHSPSADRAIDFMQSNNGQLPPDGGDRGDRLAAWTLAHWDEFRVLYVIWEQRINQNDGRGWVPMEDRGSITANHFDHVHVSFDP